MIDDGIKALTETSRPGDAWNRILKADDVIGIKFNQVGTKELDSDRLGGGPTGPLARRRGIPARTNHADRGAHEPGRQAGYAAGNT